jgi:hypothetical protein
VSDVAEHPLNYAPATSRRRTLLRRFALWGILLAFAVVAALLLPDVIHRSELLALQRKCMDYTAPPDSIVFDSRVASLPQLQRSDPDLVSGTLNGTPYVGRVPSAWQLYAGKLAAPGVRPHGTAFLHRMRNSSGHEFLVVIDLFLEPRMNTPPVLYIQPHVITPGGLRSLPQDSTPKMRSISWPGEGTFVVFAGQIDPSHADHFTINFKENESQKSLECWLTEGDSLEFDTKELTPPSPPSPASPH